MCGADFGRNADSFHSQMLSAQGQHSHAPSLDEELNQLAQRISGLKVTAKAPRRGD
jgi:hypothetical protein